MTPARFITLEGGEGAGKSTQLKLLIAALERAGVDALATREPGGSPGAEEIRRLLVEGSPQLWDAETELLLVLAARRSHLVETVWPTLSGGRWVVSDRFADSTLAYQGHGRGLSLEMLRELHRVVAGAFNSDLTLILDVPVEIGISRTNTRPGNETRFERMDRGFHARVRDGFLAIAAAEPERCAVIDASLDAAAVHAAILGAIEARLGVAF